MEKIRNSKIKILFCLLIILLSYTPIDIDFLCFNKVQNSAFCKEITRQNDSKTAIETEQESNKNAELSNPFGVFLPFDISSKDKLGPAKELGISKTRIILPWQLVEPQQDKFDFSFFDFYINRLHKLGITPIVTIKCRSSWATRALKGKPNENISTSTIPKKWQDYGYFLRVIVSRYKSKVKYWQIENEIHEDSYYWSGSNKEYIDLLQYAYKTIKIVDPSAKVVLQGFANQLFNLIDKGNNKAIDFFNLLMSNGDYFDVIDFHQYFEADSVCREMAILRKAMKKHKYKKPVICTEAGALDLRLFAKQIKHTVDSSIPEVPVAKELLAIPAVVKVIIDLKRDGLSEKDWIYFGQFLKRNSKTRPILEKYQSQDLVKRISLTLCHGVESVQWVPMADFKKPPIWFFSHMGLIDDDGRKKPHYYSYKLLIKKLKGATLELIKTKPTIIKCNYINRSPIYIVWSKKAQIINMEQYFTSKTISISKIVIELDSNNHPVYSPRETAKAQYISINSIPIFLE